MNLLLTSVKPDRSTPPDLFIIKGGKVEKFKEDYIYFDGFIYPENYNHHEIYNLIQQNGIEYIKSLNGEFSIIYYDSIKSKIFIINDRIGRKNLFYYYKDDVFIISDNFWEVVNILNPSEDDIDIQSLKEFAFTYFPLFNKTIIKNLNYFPSASIGIYDLNRNNLSITQYWEMKFKPVENLKEEDAVDEFYDCLNNGMNFIKDSNPENTRFGFGNSGGMDSRLIFPFAKNNNMDIIGFKIGKRVRYHKKLRVNMVCYDHVIAEKIAKMYGIKHYPVEYDEETIDKKINYILSGPVFGYHNINYATYDNLPDFDVLLGAGGPQPISRTVTNYLDSDYDRYILYALSNLSQLPKLALFDSLSINPAEIYKHGIKKIVSHKGLLQERELDIIFEKISRYAKDKYKRGFLNTHQSLLAHITSKNGKGVFEGLMGYKKSYTIYYPFCFDFFLKLPFEYLREKQILKMLLLKKFPKLAKIPSEGHPEVAYYDGTLWGEFLKKYNQKIFFRRGYGFPGTGWDSHPEYDDYIVNSIIKRKNAVFESSFDINKVIDSRRLDLNLYLQFTKVKAVLDTIIYKEYKQFISHE